MKRAHSWFSRGGHGGFLWVAGKSAGLMLAFLISVAFSACGGEGSGNDEGSGKTDVAGVFDAASDSHGDSGVRDTAIDTGSDAALEVAGPDVNDVVLATDTADAKAEDAKAEDVPDVQGTDVVQDGFHDTAYVDNGDPDDSITDSVQPTCSGTCEFGVDVDSCDLGYLICGCDDDNQWREYDCRKVCIEDGLLGGECVLQAGMMVCDCTSDCEDLDALDRDCRQGLLTECTCAPEDPCGWADNGVCESGCLDEVSEYFDEFMDCRCLGPCEYESFMSFCDNDRDLCFCHEDGYQDYVSCPDYCQSLGLTTGNTEYCTYALMDYLGDLAFLATCDCV